MHQKQIMIWALRFGVLLVLFLNFGYLSDIDMRDNERVSSISSSKCLHRKALPLTYRVAVPPSCEQVWQPCCLAPHGAPDNVTLWKAQFLYNTPKRRKRPSRSSAIVCGNTRIGCRSTPTGFRCTDESLICVRMRCLNQILKRIRTHGTHPRTHGKYQKGISFALRFVPLPRIDGSRLKSMSSLNVIYLFLDGATRCLVEMYLPGLAKSLSPTHVATRGLTVPLGDRTVHNAPAMMAGWPDGETWFTPLVAPHDTLEQDPAFLRRRIAMLERYLSDSLFAHFSRNGYVTQAVSANEEVDPSAGFMTWWERSEYIHYENYALATEAGKWVQRPTAVGTRNVSDYPIDVVLDMWRHHADQPKFSLIYDATAHFPHEEMLQVGQGAYERLFRELGEKAMSNTAVVIVSDHYTHSSRGDDAMLSELWLPKSIAPHDAAATPSFVTHHDWHMTVRHLATYPSAVPPLPPTGYRETAFSFLSDVKVPVGESLLGTVSPGRSKRTCRDMGVPPSMCPYSVWSVEPESHPMFQQLWQRLVTEVEKFNKFTESERAYCMEIPAPLSTEFLRDRALVTTDSTESEASGVYTHHVNNVRIQPGDEKLRSDPVAWRVRYSSVGNTVDMSRVEAWNQANLASFLRCIRLRPTMRKTCQNVMNVRCVGRYWSY